MIQSKIDSQLTAYRDKKVLVTGHTGFKGAWLSIWLHLLGAKVIGIALDPTEENNLFELSGIGHHIADYRVDIRDKEKVDDIITNEQPEILFHLAAQPLVLESYNDPLYTFEVNAIGTAHLLESMKHSASLNLGIFITTDKVYKNQEWIWPYREIEPLGGYDPYSSSKAAAELIISSYRNSFFNQKTYQTHKTSIASVRAGNVIGGGDWAAYRLVPDCIKAVDSDQAIEIRSPKSVRPWQHVLEPLGGYLILGSKMIEEPLSYNEAWNFGPENENIVNVQELVLKLLEKLKRGRWKDISSPNQAHESTLLSLDINKAKTHLQWSPILSFDETIEFTVYWYENFQKQDVYQLTIDQITKYTELWKLRNAN